ncbi:MAG: AbrB/MazE/SpoVT family DNA-binding domain-containing protein [Methylococcaceae bacterium]|nr:MAG: AbrB/MazE/SpoVT family DNA-binding domain-containing protein [Methylococcaceae bacterium]
MPTATLTSKGQVTIPIIVRKRLNIDSGDRIEFVELSDGEFALKAATRDIRELRGIIPKPSAPVSVEDMNRAIAKMGRSDENR